jgi:hypothetical protein
VRTDSVGQRWPSARCSVPIVSGEVRNAASDRWRSLFPLFNDREFVRTSARDLFSELFVREDRQRVVGLPPVDADRWLELFDLWFTMEDGAPKFSIAEVRGDRLVLGRFRLDYAGSPAGDGLLIVQFDRRIDLCERMVNFDIDDIDAAMTELDTLHSALVDT